MHLITQTLSQTPENLKSIPIPVDRHKLARRRWRGSATDSTDFGFDVSDALAHGDCVYTTDTNAYVIEQSPEDCFLIALREAKEAAWIGWMIGNLHFKAAFSEEGLLVQDDLAVEQMLDREIYTTIACSESSSRASKGDIRTITITTRHMDIAIAIRTK